MGVLKRIIELTTIYDNEPKEKTENDNDMDELDRLINSIYEEVNKTR